MRRAIDLARAARDPRRHFLDGVVDLGGLAVERAADDQKHPGGAETVDFLDHRVGGRATGNDLLHRAESYAPAVHGDCPPRTIDFIVWR